MRRLPISPGTLALLVAAGIAAWLVTRASLLAVAVAVLAGYLMMRAGWMVVGSLATPTPAPPPPGELRKVKIMFRCSICGTEVRMTSANDEVPEPPRHCQEDMELVAPVE